MSLHEATVELLNDAAIGSLNHMPEDAFRDLALSVCATATYAHEMTQARPFPNAQSLYDTSRSIITQSLSQEHLLQALTAHPRIGGVRADVASKGRADDWSRAEQSGVDGMSTGMRVEMGRLNDAYFEKFGFVFLICATGKGGSEMLQSLRQRVANGRDEELKTARGEKAKIAHIRWGKVMRELEDAG
eukprot:GFKZ01015534.1.p1 GENE.GFKZ01015534.1~~GFKZ01015534.1.p1  ORF type:complete len:188 (+),score=28.52 GFKZ01015534.1:271-834(+)